MYAGRRWVAVFGVVAAIAACTDAVDPGDSVQPLAGLTREPTSEELAELPPEFSFPTRIYDFRIIGGYAESPRMAWADAILDYWATDGYAAITMQLFKGDNPVGPMRSADQGSSETLPGRRTVRAMVSVGVPENCGYRHDATAQATVYNTAISGRAGEMLKWQTKKEGIAKHFFQEACTCQHTDGGYTGENGEMATNIAPTEVRLECSNPPEATSGGGGGGSGGGRWYEVTTTTCYGFLHLDSNGTVIHETIHGCVQTTSYFFAAA
jgi:hypothetical protein